MKRSPGGLIVTDDAQVPLRVNELRIDWDMDYARGSATQIISRGPLKEGDPPQEPVIVSMTIADVLELAATVQLQSLAYMREQLARQANSAKHVKLS